MDSLRRNCSEAPTLVHLDEKRATRGCAPPSASEVALAEALQPRVAGRIAISKAVWGPLARVEGLYCDLPVRPDEARMSEVERVPVR